MPDPGGTVDQRGQIDTSLSMLFAAPSKPPTPPLKKKKTKSCII